MWGNMKLKLTKKYIHFTIDLNSKNIFLIMGETSRPYRSSNELLYHSDFTELEDVTAIKFLIGLRFDLKRHVLSLNYSKMLSTRLANMSNTLDLPMHGMVLLTFLSLSIPFPLLTTAPSNGPMG